MLISNMLTQVTGTKPFLLNVPHAGTVLPPSIKRRLCKDALDLKDTDWHMADLVTPCAEHGVSIMVSKYSRYVVDLNRSCQDLPLYTGPTTSVVPQTDFDGHALYLEGQGPDEEEIAYRIKTYWVPYHQALEAEIQRIKAKFGFCLLLDLHSIRSQVPRLFEGVLPDLNLGTNSGKSIGAHLESAAENFLSSGSYSFVKNGRFKGGYITRHYGQPEQNVHALQLEIAQRTYMMEQAPWSIVESKADKLGAAIKGLMKTLLDEVEVHT